MFLIMAFEYNQKQMQSKVKWSEQEDTFLQQAREEIGDNRWANIARKLNHQFPDRSKTGKQCRERFLNFIQFTGGDEPSKQWSQEQTEIVFQKFMQIGSKWAQISRHLPSKTQNMVKNKFYSSLRKLLRLLNIHTPKKVRGALKPITMESITRILMMEDNLLLESGEFKANTEFLKSEIISLAGRGDSITSSNKLKEIGTTIHEFNGQFRGVLIKKYHKGNENPRKRSITLKNQFQNTFRKKPSEETSLISPELPPRKNDEKIRETTCPHLHPKPNTLPPQQNCSENEFAMMMGGLENDRDPHCQQYLELGIGDLLEGSHTPLQLFHTF